MKRQGKAPGDGYIKMRSIEDEIRV